MSRRRSSLGASGVVDVPRGLWASVWLVVKKRIKARRLRTHEGHEEKSRRVGSISVLSYLGASVPRCGWSSKNGSRHEGSALTKLTKKKAVALALSRYCRTSAPSMKRLFPSS